MLSPRPSRLLTAAALTGAASMVLAGCSTGGAVEDSAGDSVLNIVATTTQIQDFTNEIVGDAAAVTGLLKPGASAHSFDPSPADLASLGEADVLIINGAGLEAFVDSAVEASGFSGEVIDVYEGFAAEHAGHEEAATESATADTGAEDHAGHDHAEHDHADETAHDHDHADETAHDHDHAGEAAHDDGHDHAGEAAHDHDHSHDHGGVDPHIWTSPHNAVHMVEVIAEELGHLDAENADTYTANAAAYSEKLHELDAWVSEQMDRVPEADRTFTSQHAALTYFLEDYDITFVGSVIPSFEDNAEPSAAELDTLIQNIKDQNVKAVFVESSINPDLVETVAKEAGVAVSSDPIYADSLAAEGPASTYIGSTIENTRTMLTAWGVTADEPPASLAP